MTKKEEILKMVEDGTITASEAIKLLEALEPKKDYGKRMLKIDILSLEDGEEAKVKVNLPLGIAKVFLSSGNYNVNGSNILEGIDLDNLLKLIDEETVGELISVDTKEAKISIYVE